jgi:hypothetical protein
LTIKLAEHAETQETKFETRNSKLEKPRSENGKRNSKLATACGKFANHLRSEQNLRHTQRDAKQRTNPPRHIALRNASLIQLSKNRYSEPVGAFVTPASSRPRKEPPGWRRYEIKNPASSAGHIRQTPVCPRDGGSTRSSIALLPGIRTHPRLNRRIGFQSPLHTPTPGRPCNRRV